MNEELLLWMEDFDNAELHYHARAQQLMSAVREYNETEGTSYDPRTALNDYEQWKNGQEQ